MGVRAGWSRPGTVKKACLKPRALPFGPGQAWRPQLWFDVVGVGGQRGECGGEGAMFSVCVSVRKVKDVTVILYKNDSVFSIPCVQREA